MQGRVFWLTGLPGAGKTTTGRLLVRRLQRQKRSVVFLDGDALRAALGVEGEYSYGERKRLSMTYCRFCKMIVEQGVDVVIATVSLFHECHRWNRENLPDYYEIYLSVSLDVLKRRHPLFSGAVQKVVGLDIPFEEPIAPDIRIHNDYTLSPEGLEEQLYQSILCLCR